MLAILMQLFKRKPKTIVVFDYRDCRICKYILNPYLSKYCHKCGRKLPEKDY